MKLTLSWLKKHLKTNASLDEVTQGLTDIGLEVEEVIKPDNNLELFKIAQIVKAEKHPDADKLKVCDVNLGDKTVKVVCGAANARDGLKTVYAPPGAVIPKNGMKLVVAKIRGVESSGMLCSESELGVSNESEGITEIENQNVGESFFNSNSEETIDISITPNRSDCLGIRGIARDLSALGIGELIDQEKINLKSDSTKVVEIDVDQDSGCSAFGSLCIENVKNCESPEWLKKSLESLGLKPISAIVDITNYVMFDLNRPMHAYDNDKIDTKIIVRKSKKDETFEALDDKKYNLKEGSCVIADQSKILGLGGVIGGKSSAISLDTKNIVLEAAAFDPVSIAKTSKQQNIITDAKYRFERGVDINSIKDGLLLAAKLILEICGGKVSKISIAGNDQIKLKQISFNVQNFEKLIGFNIDIAEAEEILTKLGFVCKINNNSINLQVPSWRPDINQEADIIEEILRIKGLDKIKAIKPTLDSNSQTLTFHQKLFHLVQRSFASRGFHETVSWSFTDGKINKLFSDKSIKITNPISSDLDTLRSSNFSNMLIQSKANIDRSILNFSMFEVGPVFLEDMKQQTVASGLMVGSKTSSSWINEDKSFDVFDAKENLYFILRDLGLSIDRLVIEKSDQKYYHPGQSGDVFVGNKKGPKVASFGAIHPLILQKMDIKKSNLIGLEIYLDNLIEPKKSLRVSKKQFKKSNFQKVERDFAFIFDKELRAGNLISSVVKLDEIIENVKIFDVYEGDKIDANKKSLAIKVIFNPVEKTLTDKEIEDLSEKIISAASSLGGSLRSQ